MEDDGARSGLSGRGWIIVAASTVVVMAVLAVVGVLTIGAATASLTAGATASPQSGSGRVSRVPPPPAPLGLRPRPTQTPITPAGPAVPVAALHPGDCLQLYPSKWADGYPVVDCASPHLAQLIAAGTLPQPAGAPYPGDAALNAQVTDLCEAPGLLDWHWVAVWGEDVMVDLRYPDSEAKWAAGMRSYDCFVYTYSRHQITGSAMPAP